LNFKIQHYLTTVGYNSDVKLYIMANEPEMPNFPANAKTTPRVTKPAKAILLVYVCNCLKAVTATWPGV